MIRVVARFADLDAACAAARGIGPQFDTHVHSDTPPSKGAPAIGHGVRIGAAAGALLGGSVSLLVQWWSADLAFPLVVGGRTGAAWLSYIPASLAAAMFSGALGAFLAFLLLAGLPRLHNPLFDAPAYLRRDEGEAVVAVLAPAEAAARIEEQLRSAGGRDIGRVAP